ncbi:MAG: TlyA family RNA methyltransferase [Acidimicrobiales bacterium]
MSGRRRLDAELVRRGLAPSRARAAELIAAGEVLVGGAPAAKAARLVDAAEPIVVLGAPDRYVGRGAHKLEAALERFELSAVGVRALDAGASTGGFTDCLLQHGAASVVALDVGYGQLHERLRADRRVAVHERTNLRDADLVALGAPFGAVVADLSFISLRLVAAHLVGATAPSGWVVVLIKPQFEAGRREVDRGRGVISDPEVWREAVADVIAAFGAAGATMMGVMPSPIRGAEGNVEFLAWGRPGERADETAIDRLIDAAVEDATADWEASR